MCILDFFKILTFTVYSITSVNNLAKFERFVLKNRDINNFFKIRMDVILDFFEIFLLKIVDGCKRILNLKNKGHSIV